MKDLIFLGRSNERVYLMSHGVENKLHAKVCAFCEPFRTLFKQVGGVFKSWYTFLHAITYKQLYVAKYIEWFLMSFQN